MKSHNMKETADTEASLSKIDVSMLRTPIQISGKPVEQVLNSIHYGSPELRCLLLDECDLIFECKLCRALFRDLPNFISHKRIYCTKSSTESRYVGIASLPEEKVVVVMPQAPEETEEIGHPTPECPQQPKPAKLSLEDTIKRIQSGELGRSAAYQVYTEAAEKLQRQKETMRVATIRATPIPTNKNAMFIDVNMASVNIHERQQQAANISNSSYDQNRNETVVTSGKRAGPNRMDKSKHLRKPVKQVEPASEPQKLLMESLKEIQHKVKQKVAAAAIQKRVKHVSPSSDTDLVFTENKRGDQKLPTAVELSQKKMNNDSLNISTANLTKDDKGEAKDELEEVAQTLTGQMLNDLNVKPHTDFKVHAPESPASVRSRRATKKSLECPTCKAVFSTTKSLGYHIKIHHASKRIFYPCPYCPSVFYYFFGITRHLSRNHSKTLKEVDDMRQQLRAIAYTQPLSSPQKENSTPTGRQRRARAAGKISSSSEIKPNVEESLPSFEKVVEMNLNISEGSSLSESISQTQSKMQIGLTLATCKKEAENTSQSESPTVSDVKDDTEATQVSNNNNHKQQSLEDSHQLQSSENIAVTSVLGGTLPVKVRVSNILKYNDKRSRTCPKCQRLFRRKISCKSHANSCRARAGRSLRVKHTGSKVNKRLVRKLHTAAIHNVKLKEERTGQGEIHAHGSLEKPKKLRGRPKLITTKPERKMIIRRLNRGGESRELNVRQAENLSANKILSTEISRSSSMDMKSDGVRDRRRDRNSTSRYRRDSSAESTQSNVEGKSPRSRRNVLSRYATPADVADSPTKLSSSLLKAYLVNDLNDKVINSPKVPEPDFIERRVSKSDKFASVEKFVNAQIPNSETKEVAGSRKSSPGSTKPGPTSRLGARKISDSVTNMESQGQTHNEKKHFKRQNITQNLKERSDPSLNFLSNQDSAMKSLSSSVKTSQRDISNISQDKLSNNLQKVELLGTKLNQEQTFDVIKSNSQEEKVKCENPRGPLAKNSSGLKREEKKWLSSLQLKDSSDNCDSPDVDVGRQSKTLDLVSEMDSPIKTSGPRPGLQKVIVALSDRPKRKRKVPSRNKDAEEMLTKILSHNRESAPAKKAKMSVETKTEEAQEPKVKGQSQGLPRCVQSFLPACDDRDFNSNNDNLRGKGQAAASDVLKFPEDPIGVDEDYRASNDEEANRFKGRPLSTRIYVLEKHGTKRKKLRCYDQTKIYKFIDAENLKCLQCTESFTKITNLRKHVIRTHLKWSRFKCRYCKFECYDRSECTTHLIRGHRNRSISLRNVNQYIIDLVKQGGQVRSLKKTETLKVKQQSEIQEGNIYARPTVKKVNRLPQLEQAGGTGTPEESEVFVDQDPDRDDQGHNHEDDDVCEIPLEVDPSIPKTAGSRTMPTVVKVSKKQFMELAALSANESVGWKLASTAELSPKPNRGPLANDREVTPKVGRKNLPFNISTRNSPRTFDTRPYNSESERKQITLENVKIAGQKYMPTVDHPENPRMIVVSPADIISRKLRSEEASSISEQLLKTGSVRLDKDSLSVTSTEFSGSRNIFDNFERSSNSTDTAPQPNEGRRNCESVIVTPDNESGEDGASVGQESSASTKLVAVKSSTPRPVTDLEIARLVEHVPNSRKKILAVDSTTAKVISYFIQGPRQKVQQNAEESLNSDQLAKSLIKLKEFGDQLSSAAAPSTSQVLRKHGQISTAQVIDSAALQKKQTRFPVKPMNILRATSLDPKRLVPLRGTAPKDTPMTLSEVTVSPNSNKSNHTPPTSASSFLFNHSQAGKFIVYTRPATPKELVTVGSLPKSSNVSSTSSPSSSTSSTSSSSVTTTKVIKAPDNATASETAEAAPDAVFPQGTFVIRKHYL